MRSDNGWTRTVDGPNIATDANEQAELVPTITRDYDGLEVTESSCYPV